MIASKILLITVASLLLADHQCYGASIRNGRQMDFSETETIPEVDGASSQPNFISRIFDMIKNLLGLDTRTTIVRNDGTIEEVDSDSGGFLQRIGKRLLGFIGSILGVLTGDRGSPRLDYSNLASRSSNEVERELMKLANGQRS